LSNETSERKIMLMNDIENCDVKEITNAAKDLNIDISFKLENNLLINFDQTYDLTFIDTYHVYPQLIRELNKFSQVTNKYIIMHDTTIDEHHGEVIRSCNGYNFNVVQEHSKKTGYSPDDLVKGLRPAIEEFLANNPNWQIKEVFTNNNGLTVLEKMN
jgi:cephalosporin hydroxylase